MPDHNNAASHRPVNGHDHGRARVGPVTDFRAWEQSTLARYAEEATDHMAAQQERIAQLEADIKMLMAQLRELIKR